MRVASFGNKDTKIISSDKEINDFLLKIAHNACPVNKKSESQFDERLSLLLVSCFLSWAATLVV